MISIARLKNQYFDETVEVIETLEMGGVEIAWVRALEGKPFVGGTHSPVKTHETYCKTEELDYDDVCTCNGVNNPMGCPACRAYLAELYQDEIPFIG